MSKTTRLILHIGRHKSGTTSLQHFLAQNPERLKSANILYPNAGRADKEIGHHSLAYACQRKSSKNQLNLKEISQSIRREIDNQSCESVLISSESFQGLKDYRGIREFIKIVEPQRVDIVCYFREYADYMMACFRQATQNQSRFRTFDNFLAHNYPVKRFLREWGRLGTLNLKWFHPNILNNGDIVTDFCAQFGIEKPDQATWRNPSIGGNILFFKIVQNLMHGSELNYNNLSELAKTHEHFRRPFFVPSLRIDRARLTNSYNRILTKQMGPPPLKYWDEFDPLPDYPNMDADIERVKAVCPEFDGSEVYGFLKDAQRWF